MANVVRDPKEHPDAFAPDLSKPNPLLTFRREEVAFVYGSKWKQRYFVKTGDQYFVLPVQWDIVHQTWLKYHPEPGEDWWTSDYPSDPMKRPTGPLCDGCHSVDYNIQSRSVAEWNVGCEKCHGPGSEHVKNPAGYAHNIVNPARLDFVRANDTCIQCHSQFRPLSNPIDGLYYDWAVGYQAGARLSDYVAMEEHVPGTNTFFYWPDGSPHKNRMQGNDFVTSAMYTHGVTCFVCHDPHGSVNDALLVKPADALCLQCHGPRSPNGPRGSIEEHTHHKPGGPGSDCVTCHMPQIAKEIASFSVHSHTFRFISPAITMKYGTPNPCTSCHHHQTDAWALAQLRKWENESPWRFDGRN
ncbi:MAG TPA: cytochrome c3 family protein [Terriglobia bacterium]|nr:cytochrome c3 family protein [Terriglobia bacterium]